MVLFTIECKNEDERSRVIHETCEALVGSPGYKSNEITVASDPDTCNVLVVVGLDGFQFTSFVVNNKTMLVSYPERE